jgi:hypothetical protein
MLVMASSILASIRNKHYNGSGRNTECADRIFGKKLSFIAFLNPNYHGLWMK